MTYVYFVGFFFDRERRVKDILWDFEVETSDQGGTLKVKKCLVWIHICRCDVEGSGGKKNDKI